MLCISLRGLFNEEVTGRYLTLFDGENSHGLTHAASLQCCQATMLHANIYQAEKKNENGQSYQSTDIWLWSVH